MSESTSNPQSELAALAETVMQAQTHAQSLLDARSRGADLVAEKLKKVEGTTNAAAAAVQARLAKELESSTAEKTQAQEVAAALEKMGTLTQALGDGLGKAMADLESKCANAENLVETEKAGRLEATQSLSSLQTQLDALTTALQAAEQKAAQAETATASLAEKEQALAAANEKAEGLQKALDAQAATHAEQTSLLGEKDKQLGELQSLVDVLSGEDGAAVGEASFDSMIPQPAAGPVAEQAPEQVAAQAPEQVAEQAPEQADPPPAESLATDISDPFSLDDIVEELPSDPDGGNLNAVIDGLLGDPPPPPKTGDAQELVVPLPGGDEDLGFDITDDLDDLMIEDDTPAATLTLETMVRATEALENHKCSRPEEIKLAGLLAAQPYSVAEAAKMTKLGTDVVLSKLNEYLALGLVEVGD